ncbi:hypothetical protein [Bacillus marinisedimentorum]|nr:hypothetical protein [Bacillus marinisedimentorum]
MGKSKQTKERMARTRKEANQHPNGVVKSKKELYESDSSRESNA